MSDINNYAYDRLLEFYDAVHTAMKGILHSEFGDAWVEQGIRAHFLPAYFDRLLDMLQSPMKAVDMTRDDDEIFGVEHLWNIFNGNWTLFGKLLKDKHRLQFYLSEITELRNNLAHRRKRHILLRINLFRIMGNCQMVLAALNSPVAEKFADIVDSLGSGGTPWGPVLDGYLPPSDEMYAEFVGRPHEINALSDWLSSDQPQILVWGYGGAGKSALAYKFVRDVRDSSTGSLLAVCWVSAKRSEYSEGATRERPADFTDLTSFVKAVWVALYGSHESPDDLTPDRLLRELRDLPILLVVDDFDTIAGDFELAEFLFHELRKIPTRVIYTSRHRESSVKNLEVPAFSQSELEEFVTKRSADYSADQSALMRRLDAIRSVTSGYPLFVDDLIHHAALVGIDQALKDWSQKTGDAARQYALRRQIEYLSHSTGEVLIALSVANQALRIAAISDIAGLTQDDAEAGIRELQRWRMVNQVKEDDSDAPVYRMNNNTKRLVQQTFKEDGRIRTYSAVFKTISGERVPEAKKHAIGRIVSGVKERARSSSDSAEKFLHDNMTGELMDAPDLHGVLGWLYSNQRPLEEYAERAREAFHKAHKLGSIKVDTYYHWGVMEQRIAELMIDNSYTLNTPENAIGDQWKQSEQVAERGLERCGPSQPLYCLAGYAASREAKSLGRARRFNYSTGAFSRAEDWYNRALVAPVSDVATYRKGTIYRGLALAYEGLEDEDRLRQILKSWGAFSGSDPSFQSECRRLLQRFKNLNDLRNLLIPTLL